jgi:hypothetical protein
VRVLRSTVSLGFELAFDADMLRLPALALLGLRLVPCALGHLVASWRGRASDFGDDR